MTTLKLIFTIDLDAFFISCEELRRPELRGKPAIVGKELNGRGIASTSNYKAREFGIKSGMPIFKIRKILPNIKIVEPDYDYYQKMANNVFKIIKKYSNKIEFASIDECYIDVTNLTTKYTPIQIAKKIYFDIYNTLGLTVSIGISTNILLSKIASNLNKPSGITTLYKHEIETKLWKLNVNKMYMIGNSTANLLNEEGIKTIGDLANLKNNIEKFFYIKNKIGINIQKHVENANGENYREILSKDVVLKSLSKEETFEISIIDFDVFLDKVRQLFDFVYYRLERRKMICKTISIALKKDKSFTRFSLNRSLKNFTNDKNKLWTLTNELASEIYSDVFSLKQISIAFSNLKEKEKIYQQSLIGKNQIVEYDKLQKIVDDVNYLLNTNIVKGNVMKNNRKFEINKKPIDRDTVKFKVWEK